MDRNCSIHGRNEKCTQYLIGKRLGKRYVITRSIWDGKDIGNVQLSLCLTKHHTFLTSALGGGEWSASRPGRFTPGERAPGSHCT
jgi:hypothetical protein